MVERIIGSFLCEKIKIQIFFLKRKPFYFKEKIKQKLILDEDELKRGIFNILGYFALSTKVLHLPEELSKNQRKKIDFYNKNGFILLPNKTENEEKLLQMIKII